MNTLDVPVVDVSMLFGCDEDLRTALAAELVRAASSNGVFALVGHQISLSLINEVYGKGQAFFQLPDSTKKRLSNCKGGRMAGYFAPGEEFSAHEGFSDNKEGFEICGRVAPDFEEREESLSLHIYDDFKSSLMDYYDYVQVLSNALLAMFARGLGKEDNYFEQFLSEQSSQVRLLRYPAHKPGKPLEIGCGAHTDYGILTFLSQSLPGFQTYSREGEWLTLNVPPGALIVNVGDLMALWTNGRLASNLHRVINKNTIDRYALIFFLDPDCDAYIEPFDGTLMSDPGCESTPVVFHQYRKKILDATFVQR